MTVLNLGDMVDINSPDAVEVQIRSDGKVIWVNVDGRCMLRCCKIGEIQIIDQRNLEAGQ